MHAIVDVSQNPSRSTRKVVASCCDILETSYVVQKDSEGNSTSKIFAPNRNMSESTQLYFAPHCKSVADKIGLCLASFGGFNQPPKGEPPNDRWSINLHEQLLVVDQS